MTMLTPADARVCETSSPAPLVLCLRDLLDAGDCVFDVGPSDGALTMALTTLVGPAGEVHAFQPRPRHLRQLQAQTQLLSNVRVVGQAAWSRSGERLPLPVAANLAVDQASLAPEPASGDEALVETVALDDYCVALGCRPKAIHLNGTGNEYQVLQGAQQTLQRVRPVVALRYIPQADPQADCAALLESLGYWLLDASSYEPVNHAELLRREPCLTPVSLIAVDVGGEYSLYADLALRVKTVVQMSPSKPRTDYVPLPAGRYIAAIDFNAAAGAAATLAIVTDDGRCLATFAAPAQAAKRRLAVHLVFEVSLSTRISCRLDVGAAPGCQLRQVEIKRVRL